MAAMSICRIRVGLKSGLPASCGNMEQSQIFD
jgi:hypothetical protein